ncbi:hypothetical protein ACFLTE_08635 [Bacteroidota bacterium]
MGKKYFTKILWLFILGGCNLQFNVTNGQSVTLKAGVDSTHILIGDQVKLKFEITQPKEADIVFPEFRDTIIDKIEIVEAFPKDTTWLTNKEIQIVQEFIVTSFDSGFYYFPPFNFPIKSEFFIDTIQSKPFFIQVYSIPIDTTKGIFDIKTPYHTPFKISEALPLFIYGTIAILVILTVIYIIIKTRKEEPVFKRVKPKLPPHTVAFDELDKLKSEKLWQQGKVKEYYSKLTDIIRLYIEDRFFIRALEQTTDETINSFKSEPIIDNDAMVELNELLVQADFVKFAKASPLPDENDKNFQYAYNFVRRTKPVVQIENDDQQNNNSEDLELSIENNKDINSENE